jgi:hypothetical protein
MSRLAEKWYPTIGAMAAAAIYFAFARYRPLPPEVRYVFQSVMNVAAIGAGFSATTMSILMAIDARWIVQRAREAGAHELLTDYLISSLRSCVFLAVASAAALFFSPQPPQWWHGFAFAVWMGLATFASLAVWRVLHLMSIILRSISRSG